MTEIVMSTWVNLTGGAPLSYSVSGSDVVHVVIGAGHAVCELVFDTLALQAMMEVGSSATAEMDAIYQREAAARASHGRHRLG